MTKPLRKAVEIIAKIISPKKKVLEIGSRQEKNQQGLADLRGTFGEREYVGIDMRAGPGVDKVVNAEKLPFGDNSFDLVLCLEVLEHAEKPWIVAGEVERVLKPSGVAIVSSQQNFPIHNHPSDYFRYTPYGMKSLFGKLKSKLVFGIGIGFLDGVEKNPEHVVLVGSKRVDNNLMRGVKMAIKKQESLISGHKPYRHRLQRIILLGKEMVWETGHHLRVVFFR